MVNNGDFRAAPAPPQEGNLVWSGTGNEEGKGAILSLILDNNHNCISISLAPVLFFRA